MSCRSCIIISAIVILSDSPIRLESLRIAGCFQWYGTQNMHTWFMIASRGGGGGRVCVINGGKVYTDVLKLSSGEKGLCGSELGCLLTTVSVEARPRGELINFTYWGKNVGDERFGTFCRISCRGLRKLYELKDWAKGKRHWLSGLVELCMSVCNDR